MISPKLRPMVAIIVALVVSYAETLYQMSGSLCIVMGLLYFSKTKMKGYWLRFVVLNIFGLFLGLSLYVSQTSFVISQVLLILVRINIIGLVLFILFHETNLWEVAEGLKWMAVPDKLILLIVFTFRHIDLIEAEYTRLKNSATLRCFTPSLNRHSYETIANHVGMTMVRSWVKSFAVSKAMELRGFHGKYMPVNESVIPPCDKAKVCIICLVSLLPLFYPYA